MVGCIDTPSQPLVMGNLLVIHNTGLGRSPSSVSSVSTLSVEVLTRPRKQFWHWNNNLSSLVVYQIPLWPFVVTFLSVVWRIISSNNLRTESWTRPSSSCRSTIIGPRTCFARGSQNKSREVWCDKLRQCWLWQCFVIMVRYLSVSQTSPHPTNHFPPFQIY